MANGNEKHLSGLDEFRPPGRVFARQRLSGPPVPGDSERYRTVGLEIVPDAIREFIDARRVDARKKRVELVR